MASGEILVFTDADAFLEPNTLHKSRDLLLRDKLDLLSLIPGFTALGFIESALYPILAFGLLNFYPLREVNDPAKPAAFASGTFIMITREAYERVGTWRAVRNEITEDIALAKKAKRANLKLKVLRGNEFVRTEPFKRLSELFSYWKRVYYGGFEANGLELARVAANHAALFLMYVLFGVSVTMWATRGATLAIEYSGGRHFAYDYRGFSSSAGFPEAPTRQPALRTCRSYRFLARNMCVVERSGGDNIWQGYLVAWSVVQVISPCHTQPGVPSRCLHLLCGPFASSGKYTPAFAQQDTQRPTTPGARGLIRNM